MAELFSQYASGVQLAAGVIAGSTLGVSGLNPIIDRLNSISPSDDLVSGTALTVYASASNLGAPVGTVASWLKTLTGTPALPDNWTECDGSVVSDGDSVYDGETLPDLNGDNRFLRGSSSSGSTGGAATHTHTGGSHSHSFSDSFTTSSDSHTHTVSVSGSTSSAGAHSHTLSGNTGDCDDTHDFVTSVSGPGVTSVNSAGGADNSHAHPQIGSTSTYSNHYHTFSDTATTGSDTHSHTGSVSGTTGAGGTGTTSSASTLPPYYSVVWIIRIK